MSPDTLSKKHFKAENSSKNALNLFLARLASICFGFKRKRNSIQQLT